MSCILYAVPGSSNRVIKKGDASKYPEVLAEVGLERLEGFREIEKSDRRPARAYLCVPKVEASREEKDE